MKNLELSVENIKELMDKVAKNKLGGLQIKDGDFTLKIEGKKENVVAATPVMAEPCYAAETQEGNIPAEEKEELCGNIVKSPIVGTFYSSPAPGKPDFVAVGDSVKKGDVVCIVESMKLMNEIQSEFSGKVSKILLESGTAVEYGQPLLVIE